MTELTTSGPGPDLDFADWYGREFGRVRAALTVAIGDPGLAEEATAEAFARALVHWPKVRAASRPTAWVYTVALNEVRSRLRRLRLERRYLARQQQFHQAPPPEPDPQLWAAVARLPARARTAVALRYVADMSEAEVAEAMGVARGTVAGVLHKARRRLAELLDDAAPGAPQKREGPPEREGPPGHGGSRGRGGPQRLGGSQGRGGDVPAGPGPAHEELSARVVSTEGSGR